MGFVSENFSILSAIMPLNVPAAIPPEIRYGKSMINDVPSMNEAAVSCPIL